MKEIKYFIWVGKPYLPNKGIAIEGADLFMYPTKGERYKLSFSEEGGGWWKMVKEGKIREWKEVPAAEFFLFI